MVTWLSMTEEIRMCQVLGKIEEERLQEMGGDWERRRKWDSVEESWWCN